MFYISGLVGLAGCVVCILLLIICHIKDKSPAIPLIIFLFCFLIFMGSGFLYSKGDISLEKEEKEPMNQQSDDSADADDQTDNSDKNEPEEDPSIVSSPTENAVDVIMDLEQFAKITLDDLFTAMGSEGEKDAYGLSFIMPSTGQQVHGDIYYFNDGQLEFIILENQVIRCTYNAPSYLSANGSSIPFEKKEDIPLMFGISVSAAARKAADTPVAYRISDVNENVVDFWVTLMDSENKTFDQVKVSYIEMG